MQEAPDSLILKPPGPGSAHPHPSASPAIIVLLHHCHSLFPLVDLGYTSTPTLQKVGTISLEGSTITRGDTESTQSRVAGNEKQYPREEDRQGLPEPPGLKLVWQQGAHKGGEAGIMLQPLPSVPPVCPVSPWLGLNELALLMLC